jgi:putative ABC transport system permease protein
LRGLLAYNLRLAARGLQRTRGLAITSVLALGLASAAFTASVGANLHFYPTRPSLPPTLYQVELPHARTLVRPYRQIGYEIPSWAARTRVSYPEYLALAGTGVPTRQTGTLRARLLVRTEGAAPWVESVRFVDADFFSLFPLPLGRGRTFTGAEADAAVVVLGAALYRHLFGDQDGMARTVTIDGHHFQVIGVAAHDQAYWADWDLAAYGTPQDALYLPFAWWQKLRARPELAVFQSPVAPPWPALLTSDAVFVAHWAELPTPAHVRGFRAALERQFGPTGFVLRAGPAWQGEFSNPQGSTVVVALTTLVLVAAGFKMARLLLAQGLSRREELSIHRALGATRLALVGRQLLEAGLLSLPAALLGILGALPFFRMFNELVADNDIPMVLTWQALCGGLGATLLTALLAALYPGWRISRTRASLGQGRT